MQQKAKRRRASRVGLQHRFSSAAHITASKAPMIEAAASGRPRVSPQTADFSRSLPAIGPAL
jgi:hypothetical protein